MITVGLFSIHLSLDFRPPHLLNHNPLVNDWVGASCLSYGLGAIFLFFENHLIAYIPAVTLLDLWLLSCHPSGHPSFTISAAFHSLLEGNLGLVLFSPGGPVLAANWARQPGSDNHGSFASSSGLF